MITMGLNGNQKINFWFWLIMFNNPFWLLVMYFDPITFVVAPIGVTTTISQMG
jgi:hypothetical protein